MLNLLLLDFNPIDKQVCDCLVAAHFTFVFNIASKSFVPVETVGHEPVECWPWLNESWRQQFIELFGIDAQVANTRGHGTAFYARHSVEEFGRVAANGVHDLTDIVERYAARTAAVVNACWEFVLQDVLHRAAKVRARKRVSEFVGEQGRRATGAEPVRNPINGSGASAGRVVHRKRHA